MVYIVAIAIIAAIGFKVIQNALQSPPRFMQYQHHGRDVWVREDLKGKHRDYCLCFKCKRFHPGEESNCPTAQALYQNCVSFHVVTPVWECPKFRLDPSAL